MILKKIGKKLGMIGASLVLMTAQMTPFFVFAPQASATPSDEVTICHATDSHTNPYTTNTVNRSAVDEENNQYLNGHGDHTGVVWYPGVADHSWGDIIPPFTNAVTGTSFPGMNWTTEGQAIYDNGCTYVAPENVILRLKKTVINDNEGTLNADQFGIGIEGISTPVFGNPVSTDGDTAVYVTASSFAPLGHPIVVSEDDTAGYNEGEWVCANTDTGAIVANGSDLTVSVTIEPGNDVTCAIVNNDESDVQPEPTKIVINKIVVNDDEGTSLPSAFSASVNGITPDNFEDVSPTEGLLEYTGFPVGFYEVTETNAPGYTTTYEGCDRQLLEAGGLMTCTITNNDIPVTARVTVSKFVNYENGGDKPATEFPVRLNNELLTPGELMTPSNGNTYTTFDSVVVEPGIEFTISEDTTIGYTLRNLTCSVDNVPVGHPYTPAAGEEVLCNVVNVDLPKPVITATKIVCVEESLLPNWGGGGPNITSLTAINWVKDNEGCKFVEGWNFEYALNSTANPGDNVEVGGSGWTVFGPTDSNGVTSTEIDNPEELDRVWIREQLKTGYLGFTFNENSKTNVDSVTAELYCDRDVLNYDNYDYILNPEYDKTYYCAAWNVEFGTIRAIKYNDRNGNGTRESETEERLNKWGMTVYDEKDNIVASGYTGEDGEGRVTFTNLLPGTYKVCETLQDGWTNTEPGDMCKKVVLSGGEDAVARFGNTELAKVTLYKEVVNDNSGTAKPDDFMLTLNGENVESGATNYIVASEGLSINETQLEGYRFMYIYGDYECPYMLDGKMKLEAGSDVSCTVVNDDIPNPSMNVVKDGPSTAVAGSEVTYTFTVTNDGDVALEEITVEDSITGTATYVSGDTNNDTYLDLDERWIYEAKYTIPANQVANVDNTVKACGYELMEREIAFNTISLLRIIDDEWQDDSGEYEEEYEREKVCDEDTHSLSVPQVLGESVTVTPAPAEAVLATTGTDSGLNSIIFGLMILSLATITASFGTRKQSVSSKQLNINGDNTAFDSLYY